MTSDWYRPGSQDRTVIGQRKLDELQKQIMLMESEMREQSDLMHKLNRLQTIENEKKDIDDKVLERNSRNSSRTSTPRLLRSEMERLYGRESRNLNDRNKSPGVDKKMIDSVIQQRTKEFSQKQQEAAMKAKYLDKERQRLQEARRRVEEQRHALQNTASPSGKTPYFFHNDKVYTPFEPYRFPEDHYERVRDSFVLPIPKPDPKPAGKNYQLKPKYIAVPIEESDTWTRYQHKIQEEEDLDDAVWAFQSLTSKKVREQRRKRTRVKYWPQHAEEGRSVSENVGNYRNDKYGKMEDRNGGTVSADNFRESLKFGAIHDGYRWIGDRVIPAGGGEFNKQEVNLNDPRNRGNLYVRPPDYNQYPSQYNNNVNNVNPYPAINMYPQAYEQPRQKPRVRFRATPAYDDRFFNNKHDRT